MSAAAKLIDYFKSHIRKVHAMIDSDPQLPGARKVLTWICREGRKEFKSYEPFQDLKSKTLMPTQEAVDRALELLGKHHCVREREQPARPGAGRKPAPTFEVNPALLSALEGSKESQESKESKARSDAAGHCLDSLDSSDGSGSEREEFRL